MTVKIRKSQAESLGDFPALAATYAVAMRDWRAHMARVKADDGNPDIKPIDRHMPQNRPTAHELVASAVNENDEADFEIVDDGPSPEYILALRKVQLLGEITRAEQNVIAAIIPSAKARWLNIQESDVRKRDSSIVADLQQKQSGLLNKVKTAAGIVEPLTPQKISAAVNAARSEDEQKLLSGLKASRAKIEQVQRAAAKAHSDVEDLTAETIDAFKIPDFTKD